MGVKKENVVYDMYEFSQQLTANIDSRNFGYM